MLIDLTYHCSMGCTHCLSDCKPDGRHMPYPILEDTLEFCDKYAAPAVHFSGGEIFEHPDIIKILDRIGEFYEQRERKGLSSFPTTLITNGKALASNTDYQEAVKALQKRLGKNKMILQVTNDPRFYPVGLNQKEKYCLRKLGAEIDTVPNNPTDNTKCLYPQGRALENFPKNNWNTVGPKCGNLRLWVHYYHITRFEKLIQMLTAAQKYCTPTIAPDGSIKLGESALCPSVASIYDSNEEIIDKINHFDCHQCKIPFEILKNANPIIYNIIN